MSDDVGKVVWFEIYTRDLAGATAFYGGLLGWTFRPFAEYDPERYLLIMTRSGETGKGALVHRDATPGLPDGNGSGGSVLYVEVDDLEAGIRTAEALGGRVVSPRRAIGDTDGYFALVGDPDDNTVGLWSST